MSQLLYRLITSDHFSDDPFLAVAYLAYGSPFKRFRYRSAADSMLDGLVDMLIR